MHKTGRGGGGGGGGGQHYADITTENHRHKTVGVEYTRYLLGIRMYGMSNIFFFFSPKRWWTIMKSHKNWNAERNI